VQTVKSEVWKEDDNNNKYCIAVRNQTSANLMCALNLKEAIDKSTTHNADDLKMYARITNCVDVTVLQNALDRLVH